MYILNICKAIKKCPPYKINLYLTIILIVLTTYLWFVSLGEYPGLHGDEAWSANKALEIEENNMFTWNGMTYYTGSLQYFFSYISFGIFGKGILQLRVVGIIYNLCGLIIILSYLHKKNGKRTQIPVYFMILFGQSAFWMVYPRIAWEVNSFTLFFIAIDLKYLRSFVNHRVTINNTLLFLILNVMATYNHILFLCFILAGLMTILLMSIKNGIIALNLLGISVFCFFNSAFILSISWYRNGLIVSEYPLEVILVILLIILLETLVVNSLKSFSLIKLSMTKLTRSILSGIFFVGIFAFIVLHGGAFFDVVTSFKIFEHIYSFETPNYLKIIYLAIWAFILLYSISKIIWDIFQFKYSLFPTFIAFYCGLFIFFTTETSPRYYLALMIILLIYLAIDLSTFKYKKILIVLSIVLYLGTSTQLLIFYSFGKVTYCSKEIEFGQKKETNMHFFPIQKIPNILKDNRIESFFSKEKDFFIDQPLQFLKHINRSSNKGDSVMIEYTNECNSFGYRILPFQKPN